MRRAHGDPAFGVKRRNFGVECRFSVERTEGSTGGQPACEWRLGRFPWTGPITLDSRVGTPSVPGSFPETVPVDRGCCSSSCEGGRTSSAALWAPGSTRTHCISRRPPGNRSSTRWVPEVRGFGFHGLDGGAPIVSRALAASFWACSRAVVAVLVASSEASWKVFPAFFRAAATPDSACVRAD